MKNQKFHDVVVKLFGTAFLASIFIVSMITWKKFIPQFFKTVSSTKISMETKTKLENLFNESICWKNGWITLYGGSQRALLKHEINNFEVVKDNAGFLCVPVNKKSAEKISKQVDNLQYFAKLCESRKIPFLFVMAPGEVILDKSVLPTGVNDFSNENMDMFLQELSERGIPFLDTRTLFEEMPLEDICYKTDHHWALPITFKTFSEIISILNERHFMGLDKDGQYRNLENYICKSYPNCFLGSRGIKVGEWYAGMDLFRIYVPKFETSLVNQYYVKSKLKWTKQGDF